MIGARADACIPSAQQHRHMPAKQAVQPPPPPPPNPDMLKLQLEGNLDHVKANIENGKLQLDEKRLAVDSLVKGAEAKSMEAKAMLEVSKTKHEAHMQKIDSMVNLLSKVDPEKGITADHVHSLIERHFT